MKSCNKKSIVAKKKNSTKNKSILLQIRTVLPRRAVKSSNKERNTARKKRSATKTAEKKKSVDKRNRDRRKAGSRRATFQQSFTSSDKQRNI